MDGPVAVAIVEPAEVEQRFQNALRLMDRGQAALAVVVLEKLLTQTGAARIRLELARGYYLSGNYRVAKQLFVEAFKANPPANVRANILAYIDAIDRKRGKLSLSASAVRYANPLQQPGTYSLNFAGIDLTFEPDGAYRNLLGISGEAQYLKEFDNKVSVTAVVSYREMTGTLADRLIADVSIGKDFDDGTYEAKAGVTRLDQPNQSYTLPFVQASYNHSLSSKAVLRPAVRVGYHTADAGSQVSGWRIEAAVPFIFAPEPSKVMTLGPTIARHSVGYSEQSYTSLGLRTATSIKWERINFEASADVRSTRFDDVDPFWAERRKDFSVSGSMIVSSDSIRLGSLLPAIGLSCDFTRSTIRYYRQQGCDAVAEFRKVF